MPAIGIVPEANARRQGLRKRLSKRSMTSSRLPIDGHFVIGDIANTSCGDTPTASCIGWWMTPLLLWQSPTHAGGLDFGSGDSNVAD